MSADLEARSQHDEGGRRPRTTIERGPTDLNTAFSGRTNTTHAIDARPIWGLSSFRAARGGRGGRDPSKVPSAQAGRRSHPRVAEKVTLNSSSMVFNFGKP